MNELRIVTAEELKEILAKHASWLKDSDNGKRANLSSADLSSADLSSADLRSADLRSADLRSANLSYANLSSANLSYADLRYANLLLVGQDIRGYLFWAFVGDSGAVELRAGCRWLKGIAAMRAHWTKRHESDPVLLEDCLFLVDRCERMAKARGWKLEPEEVKP